MNYSQEEFNQILLSKPLNEFYLAIIENRGTMLTDEEYEKITKRSENIVYMEDSKKEMDSLFEHFQKNTKGKKSLSDIMKVVYSLTRIRHMAILTMIDNEVYDIANTEFLDLKRNKIVHYDNFANYYDETNARVRFFTEEERQQRQLKQKTVGMDVDDQSFIYRYEKAHINQKDSKDLTLDFFASVKGKPYTLFRKPNNNLKG